MTQAEYIAEIIKLLKQCDDIGLLDIIFKILLNSMPETNTEINLEI